MYNDENQDYINVNENNNNNNKKHLSRSSKALLLTLSSVIFFLAIFVCAIVIARASGVFETYETTIDYKYDSKTKSNISIVEKQIENALNKNDLTSEQLIEKYNKLKEYYDEVETYSRIEYVNICYYKNNSNAKKYEKFKNILNDLDEWFSTIQSDIYYSGYSEDFFKDYTSYQIDLVVNHPNTNESIAKKEEINKLSSEYSDEYNKLTDTQKYEYIAQFVNLNNEYAKLKNYSNYLEYAYYEEYNRGYDYSESVEFSSYINTYVLGETGAFAKIYSKLIDAVEEATLDNEITNIKSINYKNWAGTIKNYATWVGGDYLTNYNNFISSSYIIESDKGYYDGGYSTFLPSFNMPIMYLGGDNYQNLFTFIHEFGHCNAFYSMADNDVSLDLCESQSQGNEMLFLSYLINTQVYTTSTLKFLKYSEVINMLGSIFASSAVNTFETALYTASGDLTGDSVERLMLKAFGRTYSRNTRFYYDSVADYATVVMVSSPGYYISYSTSGIAALELLVKALKSSDDAINAYLYYSNYENYTTFGDTLTSAGLDNPLTISAFTNLFELNIDYLL